MLAWGKAADKRLDPTERHRKVNQASGPQRPTAGIKPTVSLPSVSEPLPPPPQILAVTQTRLQRLAEEKEKCRRASAQLEQSVMGGSTGFGAMGGGMGGGCACGAGVGGSDSGGPSGHGGHWNWDAQCQRTLVLEIPNERSGKGAVSSRARRGESAKALQRGLAARARLPPWHRPVAAGPPGAMPRATQPPARARACCARFSVSEDLLHDREHSPTGTSPKR